MLLSFSFLVLGFCSLPMPSSLTAWVAESQEKVIGGLTLPPDDAAPEEVIAACMAALQKNNAPHADAGKLLNWALAGDMMRQVHQGDPGKFLSWARRSPVFDCLVNCEKFEVEASTVQVIPGTQTRGAMAKAIVAVTPCEAVVDDEHSVRGRIGKPPDRKFLWTLQQERRPPRIGAWLLYQVLAVDQAFQETT